MDSKQQPASIFDEIPSDFVPLAKVPEQVEIEKQRAAQVEEEDKPEVDAAEDKPEEDGLSDLLAPKKDAGEPKKKPADYARERRESKRQKQELLQKAPLLEAENKTLKQQLDELRAKIDEREQSTALESDEVKALRQQLDQERKRYVAAYAPIVDPNEDEDVKKYAELVEDSLKSHIPRFAHTRNGDKKRLDLNLIQAEPERKVAVTHAIHQYAMGLQSANEADMNKAIELMGAALGDLDMDDDDLREKIDIALSKAAPNLIKWIQKFNEVKSRSYEIAVQRRAQQIAQAEEALIAPLLIDQEAADEVLEKQPEHPWANFGKVLEDVDDDLYGKIEDEVRRDAAVLGAMQFMPPPIPQNATPEQIAEHNQLVQAGQKRAMEAARYLAVGRMMIDGGLLAKLRSKFVEYEKRKEEIAGSVSVPSPGGGNGSRPSGGKGVWDEIPSNYAPTR